MKHLHPCSNTWQWSQDQENQLVPLQTNTGVFQTANLKVGSQIYTNSPGLSLCQDVQQRDRASCLHFSGMLAWRCTGALQRIQLLEAVWPCIKASTLLIQCALGIRPGFAGPKLERYLWDRLCDHVAKEHQR